MRDAKRWVSWEWKTVKGKRTKKPTIPHTDIGFDTHNEPDQWVTYDDIKDEPRVGFILGDGWSGVDFDHCVDAKGNIDPRVRSILKRIPTYAELSVSKTGIHMLFRGDVPDALVLNKGENADHPERLSIELYGKGRFFTVSGWHVNGTPTELPESDDPRPAQLYNLLTTGTVLDYFKLTGLVTGQPKPADDGGLRYPVHCPWRHLHTSGDTVGDANIFTRPDGSINAFDCQHQSCRHADKTKRSLHEVREWAGLTEAPALVVMTTPPIDQANKELTRTITFGDSQDIYTFYAKNIRWSTHGVKAQFVFTLHTHKGDSILYDGAIYAASLSDREKLIRLLDGIKESKQWGIHVGDFCSSIIAAGRKYSDDAVILADVPIPPELQYMEVQGIPVLTQHPNIWFGDGETFKSMLALWAAGHLSKMGKKVLYLDWELEAEDHSRRLKRLFHEDVTPPFFHYMKARAPILEMAERINESVMKYGIDFLIIDSVAFSIGMDANSMEAPFAFAEALREIRVPATLSIAHQTKKIAKVDRGKEKPFGSVFWANNARMLWYLQRGTPNADDSITIAFGARKTSITQRFEDLSVTLDFHGDTKQSGPIDVTVEKSSVYDAEVDASVNALKEQLEPKELLMEKKAEEGKQHELQIQAVLLALGAMPKAELREHLPDMNKATFYRVVKAFPQKGGLVHPQTEAKIEAKVE